jgi:hypothetical protein
MVHWSRLDESRQESASDVHRSDTATYIASAHFTEFTEALLSLDRSIRLAPRKRHYEQPAEERTAADSSSSALQS